MVGPARRTRLKVDLVPDAIPNLVPDVLPGLVQDQDQICHQMANQILTRLKEDVVPDLDRALVEMANGCFISGQLILAIASPPLPPGPEISRLGGSCIMTR